MRFERKPSLSQSGSVTGEDRRRLRRASRASRWPTTTRRRRRACWAPRQRSGATPAVCPRGGRAPTSDRPPQPERSSVSNASIHSSELDGRFRSPTHGTAVAASGPPGPVVGARPSGTRSVPASSRCSASLPRRARSQRSPSGCSSPTTPSRATASRCTASSASARAPTRLPAPARRGCSTDRPWRETHKPCASACSAARRGDAGLPTGPPTWKSTTPPEPATPGSKSV